MARKFLIVFAVLILLAVTARVLWEAYQPKLMALAFIPGEDFDPAKLPPAPDYDDAASWAALPEAPGGANAAPYGTTARAPYEVDVFFIHPTTYLKRASWNGPLDDAQARASLDHAVLKNQASAFADAGRIFAPRYRQATLGAFYEGKANAVQALGVAYEDVRAAFDNFIARRNQGRPFILAAHSQGSLHALGLLRDRIAGTALAERMIAAYLIGWPISVEADLAAIGLAPCATPMASGCVISWQSFALDGDTTAIHAVFDGLPGLTGASRIRTTMLCVNPLTWLTDEAPALASDNPGSVPYPEDDGPLPAPILYLVGAQCGEDGFLYLDPAPRDPFDRLLMPGKNYHVYDYALFYMSLRDNARQRTAAFLAP
ncbi:MAG: DUF3089 domain-containing protein [Pseudomonadota bacterium]